MRPQTDIYLVRLGESLRRLGYPLQEGTNLLSFCCVQIPDMEAVAEGLDDQRAHPQRAGAMLDNPVVRGVDPPARERFGARGEPTGIAI